MIELYASEATESKFDSTHRCCRGAAACSECHCWSFLPTAPWKREDRRTSKDKTQDMQLSTFGPQINTAEHHWVSPNPTARPSLGAASRSGLWAQRPRGTFSLCSKAERLTLSQMFFVEVQISCQIQTFKPVLLDAMFLSWMGGSGHGYMGTWGCAECVSEWKVLYVRLSSSRPWQKNFLSTSPPSPQALHYTGSHFFLLPPLSLFLVPSLSLSSSTSTGLSKWSQRNALWSNNPGGWHHRDKSERGGERARKTREVEKLGRRQLWEGRKNWRN